MITDTLPQPPKEEELCYDLDDFTDADHTRFAEFIEWDQDDIDKLWRVFILSRDKEFKEAEVICIMEDELQIKCKGSGKMKIMNEKLGMDAHCSIESDWEMAILKNNISGVSITRRTHCHCPACQEKIDANQPEQPNGYELDFLIDGDRVSLLVYDKDEAFLIKRSIQYWLKQPIEMPKKKRK